ncbi:hypothetical protein G7046_g7437 [Stylonectria norvegica]|nr:hypothetical protein G7046_g7437 [Stylonectria norvegica]
MPRDASFHLGAKPPRLLAIGHSLDLCALTRQDGHITILLQTPGPSPAQSGPMHFPFRPRALERFHVAPALDLARRPKTPNLVDWQCRLLESPQWHMDLAARVAFQVGTPGSTAPSDALCLPSRRCPSSPIPLITSIDPWMPPASLLSRHRVAGGSARGQGRCHGGVGPRVPGLFRPVPFFNPIVTNTRLVGLQDWAPRDLVDT